MDSRAEPHVPPYAIPPIARPVLTFPPIALAAHLQLAAAEMVRRTVGIGSMPFRSFVIPVLCIAYAWETVEHYLEADSWPMVMHWMQGVEFWGNRLIADPLALLTGALIQRGWGTPASARAVRVCTAIWLLVHLFVFANSMVLQRELATFGTVFGDKAVSWLDVWTLDHFMSGMSIGAWLSARRELLAWEPSSSTLRHGGARGYARRGRDRARTRARRRLAHAAESG